jgi:hypothetical protein
MFSGTSCSVSLLEISNRLRKLLCWSWQCRRVVAEIILKTLHVWHCHVLLLGQTEQKHSVGNVQSIAYQITFVIKVLVIYTAQIWSLQVLASFDLMCPCYTVVIKVQVIRLNCPLQKFKNPVKCCNKNESIFQHIWSQSRHCDFLDIMVGTAMLFFLFWRSRSVLSEMSG